MRRQSILICILGIGLAGAVAATSAFAADVDDVSDVHAIDLRAEHLVDPLGIDAKRPRLNWKLTAGRRGVLQSAYQILVDSSEARLARNEGDLWDSGKVASAGATTVRYAGRELKSGERVWWKVRVWDEAVQASAWSDAATWEMGQLSPDDWHGKWIARNTNADYQPLPLLRREFEVEGKIKRARAYVTGLGYFDLSINGKQIDNHCLDPGFTRYDRRVLYLTHDVTDALQSGKNAIGVMLGNGWYNVQTVAAWDFNKAPWRASPRLLVELRIEFEDGRVETIVSDGDWRTAEGPITFNTIYGGENYDARRELPGWDSPGFDESPEFDNAKWQAAEVVDAPSGKLVAQAIPAIEVERLITPAKVSEPSPGVYVFDVGQNLAGVAELEIEGPAGTEISMRYGEHLDAAGRLNQDEIGVHLWRFDPKQQFQTDKYTLKGDGKEKWHARFVYHGFQYIEVTGSPVPLTVDNLKIRWMHSEVEPVGKFSCSNPLLNKIYECAQWSYLSNLYGIPTDCPHREKNGWTGDAHLACEFGLLNYDGITVYEKWINDLGDEQRLDGLLPGIVPTGGWGYAWGNGPAWDSAFLLIPHYVYLYTGDATSLNEHYAGHKRYVDYLTTQSKDGIVDIGLGDWLPWKTETPVAVTSTGYYYVDTLIVAETARRLGLHEDAEKYTKLAESIRAAFQRKFFDKTNHSYANGGQTALSCALYQGFVAPKDNAAVFRNLELTIDRTDDHIDTGILGAKYVMATLSDHGRTDLAYKIASQETQPGWGWWLSQGATTLWEAWKQEGSNNHIMYGDVAAWFTKNLAGIQPDPESPGFKHFWLKPQPVCDLTWARASYDSVHGEIVCDWKLDETTLTVHAVVPANTTATLWLPTSDAKSIEEAGIPLADVEGAKLESSDANGANLLLGSGAYTFVCEFAADPKQ
jgi:alpha-L-rhamnosidase